MVMILRTFTYHFFQKQSFDIGSMHNWRLILGKSSNIHVFFGKGISPWKNLRLSGCRIETALQTSTVDFYSHLGWGWKVSQLIFFFVMPT